MIAIAININGKEIENPLLKIIIALAVVGLVLFIILPLLGVVLSFSVGLVVFLVPAIIIGIPLLVLGGLLFPILKILLIIAGIILLFFVPVAIIPGLPVLGVLLVIAGIYIMIKNEKNRGSFLPLFYFNTSHNTERIDNYFLLVSTLALCSYCLLE